LFLADAEKTKQEQEKKSMQLNYKNCQFYNFLAAADQATKLAAEQAAKSAAADQAKKLADEKAKLEQEKKGLFIFNL
jgi:uncharacterized protein (DUF2147 family)